MSRHCQKLSQIGFSAIRGMESTIATIESQGHRVTKLTQGLPDFDTPEHIKAACIDAINSGETQYCSNLGLLQLREAIQAKLYQDNGLCYSCDEIMITNGVSEGIFIALSALLDMGDEVLLCEPVFAPYTNGIKLALANVVRVPTYAENGYLPQVDDIAQCISAKSKLLVLINPVNPTGAVFSIEFLEQIAQLVINTDLLVIVDEIYEKIIFDSEEHHSIAKLPQMRERTVVLNGFSKYYAMSGWRLGYLAADSSLMSNLLKVRQNTAVCVNTFSQYGGVVAINGPQSVSRERLLQIDERRELLCRGLDSIDYLSYVRPKGALYVYAKTLSTCFDAYQISDKLLAQFHVAVVPWDQNHIRLSFAGQDQDILDGVAKLSKFKIPQ